jgi:hypothetical protein
VARTPEPSPSPASADHGRPVPRHPGSVALLSDDIYLRGENYVFHFSFTTWGWIHLLLGLVTAAPAPGCSSARPGRAPLAVIAAAVSMVGSFAWLPHYPIWGVMIIALDVFVMWAAIVHGRALARRKG